MIGSKIQEKLEEFWEKVKDDITEHEIRMAASFFHERLVEIQVARGKQDRAKLRGEV